MTTPNQELASHLEALGIGSITGSADWRIFGDYMEDSPDKAIAILHDGGPAPATTLERRRFDNLVFSVNVRAGDKDSAYNKSMEILEALHGRSELYLLGVRWLSIMNEAPPSPAGPDEQDNRWTYTTLFMGRRAAP